MTRTDNCAAALAGASGAGTSESNDNAILPQDSPFATRRRFLIWAAMAGHVGPERVTERILAELADEWGSA